MKKSVESFPINLVIWQFLEHIPRVMRALDGRAPSHLQIYNEFVEGLTLDDI
jgi:hypothetical protein